MGSLIDGQGPLKEISEIPKMEFFEVQSNMYAGISLCGNLLIRCSKHNQIIVTIIQNNGEITNSLKETFLESKNILYSHRSIMWDFFFRSQNKTLYSFKQDDFFLGRSSINVNGIFDQIDQGKSNIKDKYQDQFDCLVRSYLNIRIKIKRNNKISTIID